MSTKPIIVVTGATGLQGGSVARYLLQDGGYKVRATTRNVESSKAKELAAKGAEVVQADFSDLESLKKAFKGAYGVFGMTNFWDPSVGAENEAKQGKLLVDAAKTEGIKHFVWSTFERSDNPVVMHFNTKAEVNEYLIASGLSRTSLYTSMFQENFINYFPFTKTADGSYDANWPYLASDGQLWVYPAAETGHWVLEIFKKPEEWLGRDMRIMTDLYTPREFAKIVEEESGKRINYQEISVEAFDKTKDVPELYELWANIKFFHINDYKNHRDMSLTKKLYPYCLTLRQWVKANVDALFPK